MTSKSKPAGTAIEPMLAKIALSIPEGPDFLYEPKWDGFRAIVFRGIEDTVIQSRDLKSLNRYFPELLEALESFPRAPCWDGEIVVVGERGLDFDALQQRVHPAASRVAKLSKETPARFVAFDLLAKADESTMALAQAKRRARWRSCLPKHRRPST